MNEFQSEGKQQDVAPKDISQHKDREISLAGMKHTSVPPSSTKILSLLENARAKGPGSFQSTVQKLHRSIGNQKVQSILGNNPHLLSSGVPSGTPRLSRSSLSPRQKPADNTLSLEDPAPAREGNREGGEEHTPEVQLTHGSYTEVSLTISFPVAPSVTVDVRLNGKYTEGEEEGHHFIEAEGSLRVSLTAHILFLSLSAFLDGTVKIKIRDERDWQQALRKGFIDISHWFVAREMADLPALKQSVIDRYETFRSRISSEAYHQVTNSDQDDRTEEMSTNVHHWYGDTALANMVDARDSLVSDVQEIFSDHNGSVNADEIFPGAQWFIGLVRPRLGGGLTRGEVWSIRDDILAEASRRSREVATGLDHLPASENDPNVEFQATGRVGLGASAQISGSASASVEVAMGLQIGDEMGATTFNTNATDVYFASLNFGFRLGGHDFEVEVKYESEGSMLPTSATKWKVSAKVLGGIEGEVREPEGSTVQSVGRTVKEAVKAASGGGAGAALGAAKTALQGAISSYYEEQRANPPELGFENLTGSAMVGFEAEVEFNRGDDGGSHFKKGSVKFMFVRTVSLDLGIFGGDVQRGSFVGVTIE